jgi:hypothetical protein
MRSNVASYIRLAMGVVLCAYAAFVFVVELPHVSLLGPILLLALGLVTIFGTRRYNKALRGGEAQYEAYLARNPKAMDRHRVAKRIDYFGMALFAAATFCWLFGPFSKSDAWIALGAVGVAASLYRDAVMAFGRYRASKTS